MQLIFNTPKTEKSNRTIPLSSRMQELLATQRRDVLAKHFQAGGAWAENNLVFCTQLRTPLESRNLLRTYRRVLKAAGLKERGLHTLLPYLCNTRR